jgi:hypothetical protein
LLFLKAILIRLLLEVSWIFTDFELNLWGLAVLLFLHSSNGAARQHRRNLFRRLLVKLVKNGYLCLSDHLNIIICIASEEKIQHIVLMSKSVIAIQFFINWPSLNKIRSTLKITCMAYPLWVFI